jgi:adenylate cyclase
MAESLSIEELAQRSGEAVERLRAWQARGLFGTPGGNRFTIEDTERVRLIRLFLRRGIGLEAIARWVESGEMDRHLAVLASRAPGATYSITEGARRLGLDAAVLRRIWTALGFAERPLSDEDIEGLRLCKVALAAGFPEEALVQFVRVFADAMTRVAETEAHLFHFYIRRRLTERGLSEQELTQAIWSAGDATNPLAEPALLYFHRMALRHAIEDTAAIDLAEGAGLLRPTEVAGQLRVTIAFIDMAGFTALAEAMGDLKTAEVLDRFSALVRQAVGRSDGHIVKQIGDAFMLTFHDPASAVACVLEIERRATAEPQFPAVRAGIHHGLALYREGDYVGANVNVAARVASEAARHQVLVTGAVRRAVSAIPAVEFVRLPTRRLRGIAEEVELFEAHATGIERGARLVDPVCRMELGSGEVAARLALDEKDHVFCSEECLRRFVAAPERYPAG